MAYPTSKVVQGAGGQGGGGSQGSVTSQAASSNSYGRVIDVILDDKHPLYKKYGGGIAINGVIYKRLTVNTSTEVKEKLNFAYQPNANIKIIPVVGEIVEIETSVAPGGSHGKDNKKRRFYSKIVNLWNNPNSGIFLDLENDSELDTTSNGTFKELATVNPRQSTPGDIQLEGRQGQSLRFTGGIGPGNLFVDQENLGKPVVILSNGQVETNSGFSTLAEDVNGDSSSIYMLSDHSINLTQASEKREAWDENPEAANTFKGNQIVLNTGRLYLNAKEHDIQLSSIKSIGLNTEGTVNIDSTKYTCIDGSKIFLGRRARTAGDNNKEAILLGNQTEAFLGNILNILEGMARDMASAKTIKGHPIPSINKRGAQVQPVIKQLKRLINPNGPSNLKSKKVYTE